MLSHCVFICFINTAIQCLHNIVYPYSHYQDGNAAFA